MNTKNKSKILYLGWLVLGCLQLIGTSGCGQGQAGTDHLLSSGSPTEQAGEQATGAASAQMPVRVSRSFFEKSLAGEIRVQSADGSQASATSSQVAWNEAAPTDPAPSTATGTVLADFRDHQGCAKFQDAQGVELCFNIMGDVSNIGLNEREMKASGLGAAIDRQLGQGCQGVEWNVRFMRAVRTQAGSPQGFTVSFIATQTAPRAACNAGPMQVELSLKQM